MKDLYGKILENGTELAYSEMYDLYYENLVRFCFGYTQNIALAKDIVQDVFAKIWANRHMIAINVSLKSYLYRSVYNEFVKENERIKRFGTELADVKREVAAQMDSLDREALAQKMERLEKCIALLPPKCREVFLLHKKRGYTYKEISEALQISEKAVGKHICTAIKKIKKNW